MAMKQVMTTFDTEKSDNDNLGEKMLHFILNIWILYHINISFSAIIIIVYRKLDLCFEKPYRYTRFFLNGIFIEKIISIGLTSELSLKSNIQEIIRISLFEKKTESSSKQNHRKVLCSIINKD